jgi:hypothetical protein
VNAATTYSTNPEKKIDLLIKFFSAKDNNKDKKFILYNIYGKDFGYKHVYIKEKQLTSPAFQIMELVELLNKNNFNLVQENYSDADSPLVILDEKILCSYKSNESLKQILDKLEKIRTDTTKGEEISKITFIHNSNNKKETLTNIYCFCVNSNYNEPIKISNNKSPVFLLAKFSQGENNMTTPRKDTLNSGRGLLYCEGKYRATKIIVKSPTGFNISEKIKIEIISRTTLEKRAKKM